MARRSLRHNAKTGRALIALDSCINDDNKRLKADFTEESAKLERDDRAYGALALGHLESEKGDMEAEVGIEPA